MGEEAKPVSCVPVQNGMIVRVFDAWGSVGLSHALLIALLEVHVRNLR